MIHLVSIDGTITIRSRYLGADTICIAFFHNLDSTSIVIRYCCIAIIFLVFKSWMRHFIDRLSQ